MYSSLSRTVAILFYLKKSTYTYEPALGIFEHRICSFAHDICSKSKKSHLVAPAERSPSVLFVFVSTTKSLERERGCLGSILRYLLPRGWLLLVIKSIEYDTLL